MYIWCWEGQSWSIFTVSQPLIVVFELSLNNVSGVQASKFSSGILSIKYTLFERKIWHNICLSCLNPQRMCHFFLFLVAHSAQIINDFTWIQARILRAIQFVSHIDATMSRIHFSFHTSYFLSVKICVHILCCYFFSTLNWNINKEMVQVWHVNKPDKEQWNWPNTFHFVYHIMESKHILRPNIF